MPRTLFRRPAALVFAAGLIGLLARSTPVTAAGAAPAPADLKKVIDKAYDALKEKQGADGSFAPRLGGPGVTALTVAALIQSGRGPDDPVVAKGLKYLEGRVKPDGGVYDKGLANYTTCLAIVAFKDANKDGKYDQVIANATKYVKTLQYGDDAGAKAGGTGYGAPSGRDRPDLSNTHFFMEAILAAGTSQDDAAVKRAVAFVGRCQNLPGESNDQAFAKKATEGDKGGFVYNPADQDNAKSEKRTAAGGLRSEGGMTYAGLKSFLYAGIGKDDPRVKAAVAWMKKHYTVTENPGQGQAGLFYYYHTFAKALSALGEDEIATADGTKHAWRTDLFNELKKRQKPDGTWVNTNGAFAENSPELATAFAVLALSYCKDQK